jgi:HAD superfamily hydrolase (TIGR01549 family)
MRRWLLVAFDLDGVLIDSRANMHVAWSEVRARCGYDVAFEQYFARIGLPFREILAQLGIREHLDEAEATYARASIESFDLIAVYPGVRKALARLRDAGFLLGVVTSKDAARTSLAVRRLAVPFDVVQPPAPGLRGKPAPDQLLAAAAAVGVPADRTLYVGDMPVDAMTARHAGAGYAHAAWGYGPAPEGTDLLLPAPRSLPDFLTRERETARLGT